jgi:hypothetical protein
VEEEDEDDDDDNDDDEEQSMDGAEVEVVEDKEVRDDDKSASSRVCDDDREDVSDTVDSASEVAATDSTASAGADDCDADVRPDVEKDEADGSGAMRSYTSK